MGKYGPSWVEPSHAGFNPLKHLLKWVKALMRWVYPILSTQSIQADPLLGLIQTERVSNTPEFSGEEESESDLQNLDPQFVPDASVFDQGDEDLQPSRTYIHDCQKESNAKFVLGLAEGHRVSDAAVQYVIDGCRKVSAQTAAHIQEVVKNKLSELEVDISVIEHVHQKIDDCFVDPFDGLGTPYLRDKYFKEHFHYLVSGSVTHKTKIFAPI